MRNHRLLLIAIVLFPFLSALGEEYRFNHIDAEQGLTNSEVVSIHKNRQGFIWMGTPTGLFRYDGYQIICFKQNLSSHSATDNNIYRIQEASDGMLWVSTKSGQALFNPDQERFVDNAQSVIRNYAGPVNINNVYIDLGGNYWFTTLNDVRMYNARTQKRIIFRLGTPGGLHHGIIKDIRQGKNRYWFLYDDGTVDCMDAQTLRVIFHDTRLKEMLHGNIEEKMALFTDLNGDVWIYNISSHFGIARFDVSSQDWVIYSTTADVNHRLSNNTVTCMEEDEQNNIWIGTDHGGITVLHKDGRISYVKHSDTDNHSLAQDAVKCLFHDNKNILWVGTYKSGVSYYHESIFKFKQDLPGEQLPYKDINCFLEADNGNLWIGTNGGGLLYYDCQAKNYRIYRHESGNNATPAGNVVMCLAKDHDGRLWIGYYQEGLDCFDGRTFQHHRSVPNDPNTISDNNIWVLLCDKNNRLWAGTLRGGISVIDPSTGRRIQQYPTNGSVYSLIQRKDGRLLAGSQSGVYIYNASSNKLDFYENDFFSKIQLSRYDVNYMREDTRGILWIGTRNGLFAFNPLTRKFIFFSKDNGLSSDIVQSILEDSEHNMWIATNRGLTHIKVSTRNETPGYFYQLTSYNESEGLQNGPFNFSAGYVTSHGELIFGGAEGLNLFEPSEIGRNVNNNDPEVIITGMQIYSKQIHPDSRHKHSILKHSISDTRELTLPYSDNYISLSFAAFDYCMPDKIKYYYRLEGLDDRWLEADPNTRQVTYTNLSPGTYTFTVRAVNNDGFASSYPAVLVIHIKPPFWRSVWAIMLYAILIIGVAWYWRRRVLAKTEKKLHYAEERLHTQQQHEMDEMKLSFFTNISHEFRTPLTLIITPVEDLLNKNKNNDERKLLEIIRRNALQLLDLVNQLLDFRKLDVQHQKASLTRGDMVHFVKDQAASFVELMERKHITFTVDTALKELYLPFDSKMMSRVLSNVLSNAWKFTPSEGHIKLSLEKRSDDKAYICVLDNGIGIPKDSISKIFDRFYQVHYTDTNYQGSGIGLHIAKEFMHLQGGDIFAENIATGGCCFTMVLPCTNHIDEEEESLAVEEEILEEKEGSDVMEDNSEAEGLPKLLLVEDNDDFREYLASRLRDQYFVVEAHDGKEGLDTAFKVIPDMIISDVMMPHIDGIAMSHQLKSDIRTSHIPLILLTAKSGEESKLEGLKAGADDYITKPFNLDILLVKIHNLVEARNQNRKLFQEHVDIEPSKITVTTLDEQLMKKAVEITEAHMANPDFSVENLSRELGMSRVHLYKKLTSLTGKTPIEFIRLLRLKRAAQLLEDSQRSIAEVAYAVGFNNPKYFRKYFKDEFGILPSQYGKREGETETDEENKNNQ